jgi:hypothetical protein
MAQALLESYGKAQQYSMTTDVSTIEYSVTKVHQNERE